MKTSIAVLSGLALTASPFLQPAQAGNREWATAGKILTGVAAVHILSRAFDPPPVYQTVYTTPVVVQAPPQVVYQPVPVVVQQPAAPVVVQAPPAPAPAIPNAPTVPPAPVVNAAPPPTYVVQQQPVYVQQAPVYVAPAPVYVAPVYIPPPVVSFGFGFGHYYGRGPVFYGHRHCW